jgi:rsbT co-antagonist protein RsbR
MFLVSLYFSSSSFLKYHQFSGGIFMEEFLGDFIEGKQETVINKWTEEITREKHAHDLSHISDEVYKNTNREFLEIVLKNLENKTDFLAEDLKHFSERLIKLGWPLNYITEGLQTFRRVVLDLARKEGVHSVDPMAIVVEIDRWIDPIINQMVQHYSGSWENIITLQKVALQELSSPLIPLLDGIAVMPLIGTVDTERAKLIMENLLDGVVKQRAEVVLIDITGVPVVDTMVAHHIIQAVEAVRLIGSKAILVGIRPEIAQTIVNLGIDLSDFPTKNSMKKGIETALKLTNREIVLTN